MDEFIAKVLNHIFEQGLTVSLLALALYYLLGLAKLGAAVGLYSTGIGGAIAQGVMAIFGIIDVIRNEKR
jgi:hypothetical protein